MNTRWTAIAGIVALVAAGAAVSMIATDVFPGYSPERADPQRAWETAIRDSDAANYLGSLVAVVGGSLVLFFTGLAAALPVREPATAGPGLMAIAGSMWGATLIVAGALLYLSGETAGYLEYPEGGLTMYLLAGLPSPGGPFAALPAVVALAAGLSLRGTDWPRWLRVLPFVAAALFAVSIIPIWPILAMGAVGLLVLLVWLVATSVRLLRTGV